LPQRDHTPSTIMSPARNQPWSRTEVSPGARAHTTPLLQRAHAPPPTNTAGGLDRTDSTSKQGASCCRKGFARDFRRSGARRARIGPVAQSIGKERDHALAVGDSFVSHGHAQTGDGVQEISGTDVGANLATGCRGFEQQSEGGSEPLPEVPGQFVERRLAGVKGRSESWFEREELGVPVQPVRECCCWLLCGGQGLRRISAGIYLALKHGLDQIRALRKVPVQRSNSDAG